MKITTTKTDEELLNKWKALLDINFDECPELSPENRIIASRWLESCEDAYPVQLDMTKRITNMRQVHCPVIRVLIGHWQYLPHSDIGVVMENFPFSNIDTEYPKHEVSDFIRDTYVRRCVIADGLNAMQKYQAAKNENLH